MAEANEIIDLTDVDDYIEVRIPGEPLNRVHKRDFLAFTKRKCTKIFEKAGERCHPDKLERTLQYHPDTLARANKNWLLQCYEKDWKADLKAARVSIEKELKKSEKICKDHDWEDQQEKYDREWVQLDRDRLAEANAGEAAFKYLVDLLRQNLQNLP